jgi:tetratricopeptide (TPR) repeat protein
MAQLRLRAPAGGATLLAAWVTLASPSPAQVRPAPRTDGAPATGNADKAPAPGARVERSAAPLPDAALPAPALAPKVELEGPEAEAKERARGLFLQGVAEYREGRFYEAVAIFLETQRIYPDNQLCFNIARAYENLGNLAAALRYYRDYLRQADRPSDGDEVRERVRKLSLQLAQRGVQQLTVLSSPVGATALLDGHPVGITPWTGETYPGKHRVTLTLEGHATHERVVDIDAFEARDMIVALRALPPPPPPPTRLVYAPKPPGVSVPTLITLGTGLALLGAAVTAQALSSETGMSRTAAFFSGSGLGVSAVGGFMLYFDLAPSGTATSQPGRKDFAAVSARGD